MTSPSGPKGGEAPRVGEATNTERSTTAASATQTAEARKARTEAIGPSRQCPSSDRTRRSRHEQVPGLGTHGEESIHEAEERQTIVAPAVVSGSAAVSGAPLLDDRPSVRKLANLDVLDIHLAPL